jgi:hypothetical protein
VPYCSANAASSSAKPNSCAVGHTDDDVRRRRARLDQRDRLVHVLAAARVGVALAGDALPTAKQR